MMIPRSFEPFVHPAQGSDDPKDSTHKPLETEAEPTETMPTASQADAAPQSEFSDDTTSEHSDADMDLPPSQRLVMALSCKDEGSRLLKNGQLEEAFKLYKDGLAKLRGLDTMDTIEANESSNSTVESEVKKENVHSLKLGLHLNLSLCSIKLNKWVDAIDAASAALKIDANNVKALYRRGMAHSRSGMLEEARVDFLRIYELETPTTDVKKELDLVNKNLKELRSREKQAYRNIFSGSQFFSAYEQRAEQEKRKEAEALKRDQEMFEAENKKREKNGEALYPSLEAWREERQRSAKHQKLSQTTTSSPSSTAQSTENLASSNTANGVMQFDADDLDEEDKKILAETRKMGYCYFNRQLPPEEKQRLAAISQPVKVANTAVLSTPVEPQKTLSSWNQKGTTFEERDCSHWAKECLTKLLQAVTVNNTQLQTSPEQLQQALSDITSRLTAEGPKDTQATQVLSSMAASLTPFTCKISAVNGINGDAQAAIISGTKRYLYDFTLDLCWSLSLQDPLASVMPEDQTKNQAVTYTGRLDISDVSSVSATTDVASSNEPGCPNWLKNVVVSYKTRVSPEHQPVVDMAMKLLKEEIVKAVHSFEADYRLYA